MTARVVFTMRVAPELHARLVSEAAVRDVSANWPVSSTLANIVSFYANSGQSIECLIVDM